VINLVGKNGSILVADLDGPVQKEEGSEEGPAMTVQEIQVTFNISTLLSLLSLIVDLRLLRLSLSLLSSIPSL